MSSNYKILKIPISREKSVFYYYRQYQPKGADGTKGDSHNMNLVDLPVERTLYVCHFVRPIDENTIQKYFGLVGKIKQIHIGEYKNKANNKRKRRVLYFAIIVYKHAEDC